MKYGWFGGRGLYSGIVWVGCMVVVCSSGNVLLLRDCVMCWYSGMWRVVVSYGCSLV